MTRVIAVSLTGPTATSDGVRAIAAATAVGSAQRGD